MDDNYVLQILRDYGRDIECTGSFKIYDNLTTAIRHFNAYKKEREVVHLRLMWGSSCIDEWRREDG